MLRLFFMAIIATALAVAILIPVSVTYNKNPMTVANMDPGESFCVDSRCLEIPKGYPNTNNHVRIKDTTPLSVTVIGHDTVLSLKPLWDGAYCVKDCELIATVTHSDGSKTVYHHVKRY